MFRKDDGTFDREAFDNKLFLTDTFSFGTKIGENVPYSKYGANSEKHKE